MCATAEARDPVREKYDKHVFFLMVGFFSVSLNHPKVYDTDIVSPQFISSIWG